MNSVHEEQGTCLWCGKEAEALAATTIRLLCKQRVHGECGRKWAQTTKDFVLPCCSRVAVAEDIVRLLDARSSESVQDARIRLTMAMPPSPRGQLHTAISLPQWCESVSGPAILAWASAQVLHSSHSLLDGRSLLDACIAHANQVAPTLANDADNAGGVEEVFVRSSLLVKCWRIESRWLGLIADETELHQYLDQCAQRQGRTVMLLHAGDRIGVVALDDPVAVLVDVRRGELRVVSTLATLAEYIRDLYDGVHSGVVELLTVVPHQGQLQADSFRSQSLDEMSDPSPRRRVTFDETPMVRQIVSPERSWSPGPELAEARNQNTMLAEENNKLAALFREERNAKMTVQQQRSDLQQKYNQLQDDYERLKQDNDRLRQENERLRNHPATQSYSQQTSPPWRMNGSSDGYNGHSSDRGRDASSQQQQYSQQQQQQHSSSPPSSSLPQLSPRQQQQQHHNQQQQQQNNSLPQFSPRQQHHQHQQFAQNSSSGQQFSSSSSSASNNNNSSSNGQQQYHSSANNISSQTHPSLPEFSPRQQSQQQQQQQTSSSSSSSTQSHPLSPRQQQQQWEEWSRVTTRMYGNGNNTEELLYAHFAQQKELENARGEVVELKDSMQQLKAQLLLARQSATPKRPSEELRALQSENAALVRKVEEQLHAHRLLQNVVTALKNELSRRSGSSSGNTPLTSSILNAARADGERAAAHAKSSMLAATISALQVDDTPPRGGSLPAAASVVVGANGYAAAANSQAGRQAISLVTPTVQSRSNNASDRGGFTPASQQLQQPPPASELFYDSQSRAWIPVRSINSPGFPTPTRLQFMQEATPAANEAEEF